MWLIRAFGAIIIVTLIWSLIMITRADNEYSKFKTRCKDYDGVAILGKDNTMLCFDRSTRFIDAKGNR